MQAVRVAVRHSTLRWYCLQAALSCLPCTDNYAAEGVFHAACHCHNQFPFFKSNGIAAYVFAIPGSSCVETIRRYKYHSIVVVYDVISSVIDSTRIQRRRSRTTGEVAVPDEL
jgi:hypothetical protein